MTNEEIEKYYQRCEFDDECDFCDSLEGGSYVQMCGSYPGSTPEADFYICGKCAPGKIQKEIELAAAWCDEMDKRLESEARAQGQGTEKGIAL